jgi:hypothetical protein
MKIDLQLVGLIIFFLGLVLVIGTDYSTRQILALSMMAFGAILIVSQRFWNRVRRKK